MFKRSDYEMNRYLHGMLFVHVREYNLPESYVLNPARPIPEVELILEDMDLVDDWIPTLRFGQEDARYSRLRFQF